MDGTERDTDWLCEMPEDALCSGDYLHTNITTLHIL